MPQLRKRLYVHGLVRVPEARRVQNRHARVLSTGALRARQTLARMPRQTEA